MTLTDIFEGVGLAVDRPTRVEIVHPGTGKTLRDAEGNPAWIDVVSGDSARARSAQAALSTARAARQRPGDSMSAEDYLAERAEMLAAITIGWNVLRLDGTKVDVPFSAANAKALFMHEGCGFWMEQGYAAANTRANFIPAPAKP
jgi:hypothetical protein